MPNYIQHQEPVKLVKMQKGMQIIGDYYVIQKKRSLFMYQAMNDCRTFALQKRFLHKIVFKQFPDFHQRVSERSYGFYKHWIFKPVSKARQYELDEINNARL